MLDVFYYAQYNYLYGAYIRNYYSNYKPGDLIIRAAGKIRMSIRAEPIPK